MSGRPAPVTFDPARVRALVFDLDGTLVDSYDAIADSLNSALCAMGRAPLPPAAIRSMVGRGLETLVARALSAQGGPAPDEADVTQTVRLFRARYDQVCVPGTSLLPGVAATLREFHARGLPMGVATNKPSYFARRLLDALGVGVYLRAVMGPDLVRHHKPHPEMVHAVLATLEVAAAEALYVGDMEIDVETARAAGMPVVVMPTGSCDRESLGRCGADRVLPDFAALLDLLPRAAV